MKREERIGETKCNNENCLMKIIEYNNNSDIIVEFQDEFKAKIHSTYANFKNGEIKNPYHKSVYENGYIGEGYYTPTICRKITIQYTIWSNMLKRCYDKKLHKKHPTYKDCTICEEWHNFQNFAQWYDENFYSVDVEIMCLDKDILFKGNKIYNTETCVFVPQRINTLFVKRQNDRGECPVGVAKNGKSFRARLSYVIDNSKIIKHLGCYKTKIEAFEQYKKAKEEYIKEIAEEYREKIPQKLYEALYRYEIEITD